MNDWWPTIYHHFEGWRGADPLALTPGIRLLAGWLDDIDTTRVPDPERWAHVLNLGSAALARLIELSASEDPIVAETARGNAAAMAPLLARMAGESTRHMARAWRSS